MKDLKNIIFDLGAVLLDIDYDKTTNAFLALGYDHFTDMYSKFKVNSLFDHFETGQISNPEFFEEMISAGNGNVTEDDIRRAWNAMLLDFRESSFHYIEKLSGKYRIYLLSNTNAVHQSEFESRFLEQMKTKPFREYFTRAYFSNEVGLRKPNAEIFEYLINDAGIKPEESLFIDDIKANTEAAQKLGFKTHILLPHERIEDLDYYLISS
jgi:putative hydrolase of the HAD superfamily